MRRVIVRMEGMMQLLNLFFSDSGKFSHLHLAIFIQRGSSSLLFIQR